MCGECYKKCQWRREKEREECGVQCAVCSVSRVQSERSVGSVGSVASVVATVAVGSTLTVSRSGM